MCVVPGIAQPVPDQTANVEFVIEDAGPAFAVAVDGALPPAFAGGAGDAFGVQLFSNGLGRLAGGIVVEDAADDSGLEFVDLGCQ